MISRVLRAAGWLFLGPIATILAIHVFTFVYIFIFGPKNHSESADSVYVTVVVPILYFIGIGYSVFRSVKCLIKNITKQPNQSA